MHIALLLLSILPMPDGVLREPVDLIEVNHYYDEQGRLVFDQMVFYDFAGTRYDVRAWSLMKSPEQRPTYDHASGRYFTLWDDQGTMRRVSSQSIRETWTQHDVEELEREILPRERRRGLRK